MICSPLTMNKHFDIVVNLICIEGHQMLTIKYDELGANLLF